MDFSANKSFQAKLLKRQSENALRKLSISKEIIDFTSNDYLGFARNKVISNSAFEFYNTSTELTINGSGGSRLLSGNSEFCEQLELEIAAYHHAEAALIYNSGYDANLGLLSCIAGKDDTIIYDELVHASIRDGLRLSLAKSFAFKHNDLDSLQDKLQRSKGHVFVVVESVYSMDGDVAPLKEIALLCEQVGANLLVDEAHATGIIGENGEGLVVALGIEKKVIARVHTFGKALGAHGACVVGSELLKKYLINFSRSFIYTTALPLHSLCTIIAAYHYLKAHNSERSKLYENINLFNALLDKLPTSNFTKNTTPIKIIHIPGNNQVKQFAKALQENGFAIKPVLSPTVALGKERLRICLHSFNTANEIEKLANQLTSYLLK
ncbi:MAG: pyridoxal phosphate-dependent aminotransferase family protein [Bacteroidetes bacterium]|nr:pyridoxal phosphate-dependent aminotransferase family protein [Bacteroidota bacterium]